MKEEIKSEVTKEKPLVEDQEKKPISPEKKEVKEPVKEEAKLDDASVSQKSVDSF